MKSLFQKMRENREKIANMQRMKIDREIKVAQWAFLNEFNNKARLVREDLHRISAYEMEERWGYTHQ